MKIYKETTRKPYLICLDSDGCVFDTMELKHKEYIGPTIVNAWGLQGISRYVRETMEFVNLYSVYRGIHPMRALVITMQLLERRPEVLNRKVPLPDLEPLIQWLDTNPVLNESELDSYMCKNGESETLLTVRNWAETYNAVIKEHVKNTVPFLYVEEALKKLSEIADIIVVSTAPEDQLEKEWSDNALQHYLYGVAGQDSGSKADSIRTLMKDYEKDHILMIGDAPGDHEAAQVNRVKFFPIVAGHEEESWNCFLKEIIPMIVEDSYTEEIQKELLEKFYRYLPKKPSWTEIEMAD